MSVGLYAGSFDPITIGHLDIIERSLSFCEKVIVGIGNNSAKKTKWDADTRIKITKRVLDDLYKDQSRDRIEVMSFHGLLVDFAKENNTNVIIRGIRSVSDFEYEINLANINKTLNYNVETVFLPTSPDLAVVSSSMVKEIHAYGGDISRFVHPFVRQYLAQGN